MAEEGGLPKFMTEKIERNREKAIAIKRSKLMSHPYTKGEQISEDTTIIKIGVMEYTDTGSGFLLGKEPDTAHVPDTIAPQAPIFQPDQHICEVCNEHFGTSWLCDNFALKCCDTCRNPEIHKLVAKTEAKLTYLLKDCDLDKREPPLKFITQKNPHNIRWGDMKLYLQIQVEKRALEVWGSEEKIEQEKELRGEKRLLAKSKKYKRQLRELRKGMRSSLYDRTTSASHAHEFGPETYNEEEDTYHRKCTTCPYEETFEKM